MSDTKEIAICESGVDFGPYPREAVFPIEKSVAYAKLKSGFRTVEFVLLNQKAQLVFVEAKATSPRPISDNDQPFEKYIEEIAVKFEDAYQLFLSVYLGRSDSSEMGRQIQTLAYRGAAIVFALVIPRHETEWLPPILDKLNKRLRKITKLWNIRIAVLNEEGARQYRLIA